MKATLPRYRTRLIHLTAVWAYGVTQPVLSLVGGNPDLIISRGASRLDLVLFAVIVALGVPLLAVAYCRLVAFVSSWAADVLYLAALAVCIAPFAARLVRLVDPALGLTVLLVTVLSALGVAVYRRARAARLFAGYSIVLPVVAVASFGYGLPTLTGNAQAARIDVASPAPVVLLVFDELAVSSLLTAGGEIDAVRYPNFARLARDGTWYPNATTVHEWTSDAVPAIVTGTIEKRSRLPIFKNHPQNLFSLLGGSYEIHVEEQWTQLCPEPLCAREQEPAAAVVHGLARDAARLYLQRVAPSVVSEKVLSANSDIALEDEATASADHCGAALGQADGADSTRSLYYCHVLLPHAPWQYLPSGRRYDSAGMDGWNPNEWWSDETWPVLQGHQRYLLQLGYTDRYLGTLLRSLDLSGMYDGSLVVAVADHGVSFRPSQPRRQVGATNFADIANVPLFVKLPGQRRGRVDERAARTVDVVPTIADVLGVQIPWRLHGESLLRPATPGRGVLIDLRGDAVARMSLDELVEGRKALVAERMKSFGEGSDSLFAIGANRSLLGRAVDRLPQAQTTVRARIAHTGDLANVRRASGFVPARISGTLTSGSLTPDAELAVAVNGTVRALTRAFDDGKLFRALVPETSFVEGRNEVDVFLVRGSGKRLSLAPIGSS